MSYRNRGLGLRYKIESHQTMNKICSHNDYIKYQENKKTKRITEKYIFLKKELGVGELSKYREDIKNLQL